MVTVVLATGVTLIPFRALWRVLDLALGERVGLDIGYNAWLVCFWYSCTRSMWGNDTRCASRGALAFRREEP
jgi:hypothetical protein